MKKSGLFTLLLLTSLIPSYSLCQVSNDTTVCYGVSKLQKIALALTKGQDCDTLLKITKIQITNRDSVISDKNRVIKTLQTESSLKESIISVKEQEKETINLQLKQVKRRLFFTKLGWLSTSLALTAGMTYFAFH